MGKRLTELAHRAPKTLYHYTTQEGLLGIFTSGELWASKIQYLNDSTEFALALRLADVEFSQRLQSADSSTAAKLRRMAKELRTIENINVFVCSFSALGDSLGQWRAYGGPTAGFSIGFDVRELRKRAKNGGFFLAPCVYDEAKQKRIISNLIEQCSKEDINVEELAHHPEKPNTLIVLPLGGTFMEKLLQVAPILKHHSFREEREWRLISRPFNYGDEKFGLRAGKSMITPYYRLLLKTADAPLPASEIIVGPAPHMEKSEAALTALLHRASIRDGRVRRSEVPYRTW